jgi:hypothetical protein
LIWIASVTPYFSCLSSFSLTAGNEFFAYFLDLLGLLMGFDCFLRFIIITSIALLLSWFAQNRLPAVILMLNLGLARGVGN